MNEAKKNRAIKEDLLWPYINQLISFRSLISKVLDKVLIPVYYSLGNRAEIHLLCKYVRMVERNPCICPYPCVSGRHGVLNLHSVKFFIHLYHCVFPAPKIK